MKRILSALGVLLMVFNGIAVFSLLVTLPDAFKAEKRLGLLLSYLLMLLFFSGMIYLGYRLKKLAPSGGKPLKHPKAAVKAPLRAGLPAERQAQEVKPPAEKRKTEPETMKHASKARDEILLYSCPEADLAAAHTGCPAVKQLIGGFRDGRPFISVERSVYTEVGVGKGWIDHEISCIDIPEELEARLDIDSFKKCLGADRSVKNIDWNDRALTDRLSLWCHIVRDRALHRLPDCVYEIPNPFDWLEDVGPDGIDDRSGIWIFLRLKEGAAPAEAVRALADRQKNKKSVIMADNDSILLEDGSFTAEELEKCLSRSVLFCALEGEDVLRSLTDRKRYKVRTQEWPGSADDAATYGRWWLEELEYSEKDRIGALKLRIAAECRSMHVSEVRIKAFLKKDISGLAGGDTSSVTHDRRPAEHTSGDIGRGNGASIVPGTDEKSLRFGAIRDMVYDCRLITPQNRADAEELLRLARQRFENTYAYRELLEQYYGLFPDSDKLPDMPNPLECVLFGHYRQSADGDDVAPIEWSVLKKERDKLLLLSRRTLDARTFSGLTPEPSWETSDVRKWLNGAFIDSAFSEEERGAIIETALDNSASGWSWGYGRTETIDRVFLLSYAEASDGLYERKCIPTDYAAARMGRPADSGSYCSWMLRTPGYEMHDGFHITIVSSDGARSYDPFFDRKQYVRPALWVRSDYPLTRRTEKNIFRA